MSRSSFSGWAFLAGLGLALGGCCGGAHSHKCDFTALSSQNDGGSDGPPACGAQVCQPPQVCCLKKIAPYASCVDVQDFAADQCEMPTVTPDCFTPADCDPGMVCCLVYMPMSLIPPTINCKKPQDCQPDGTSVYLTCGSDQDCPSQQKGTCRSITGGDVDAGAGTLNVCGP